jgi:hypothetical protein
MIASVRYPPSHTTLWEVDTIIDGISLSTLLLVLCQVVDRVTWPRLSRWKGWKSAPTSPNELLNAISECKEELRCIKDALSAMTTQGSQEKFRQAIVRGISEALNASNGLVDTTRGCERSLAAINEFLNTKSQRDLQHRIVEGVSTISQREQSLANFQDALDTLSTRISDMCNNAPTHDSRHDPTQELHRRVTTALNTDIPPGSQEIHRDQPAPEAQATLNAQQNIA